MRKLLNKKERQQGVLSMVERIKQFAFVGSMLALILAFTVTANASSHPTITSSTHPDGAVYYSSNDPLFQWSYDPGAPVQGYSYSLDQNASGEPDTSDIDNVTEASYEDLADGTWYLHVKGVDNANNWSDTAHYAINIDTAGPTGTVSINNGAETATENNVTLTIDAADTLSGVAQMRYAESAEDLAAAVYGAYNASAAVTLSAGNGAKTIYIQFKDAAGNESTIVSDGITLASTAVDNLPRISIALNAKRYNAGEIVYISGTLTDVNGDGISGQTVSIKSRGKTIGTVTTGDGGAYTYEHQPTKNTPYKAVYIDVSGEKINSKSVVAHVVKAKKAKPVKPAKPVKVKKAKKGTVPAPEEPVVPEEPIVVQKASSTTTKQVAKDQKGHGKGKATTVKAAKSKK